MEFFADFRNWQKMAEKGVGVTITASPGVLCISFISEEKMSSEVTFNYSSSLYFFQQKLNFHSHKCRF